MKYIKIPKGVLARTFKCADQSDLDMYVRLDTWGEGSCFFHSLCMLLVSGNMVSGNTVTYTLSTPTPEYQSFEVEIKHPTLGLFRENFREVGIQLRQRLSKELADNLSLWTKFTAQTRVNLDRTDKVQTAEGAVEELSKVSVWADIWTIRYAAWRLKVNALFVNPSAVHEPIYCGVENFSGGALGNTVFIYWSDHVHFEPIVKLQQEQCTMLRHFGQNHRFVKCIRDQYKNSCPLDPVQ